MRAIVFLTVLVVVATFTSVDAVPSRLIARKKAASRVSEFGCIKKFVPSPQPTLKQSEKFRGYYTKCNHIPHAHSTDPSETWTDIPENKLIAANKDKITSGVKCMLDWATDYAQPLLKRIISDFVKGERKRDTNVKVRGFTGHPKEVESTMAKVERDYNWDFLRAIDLIRGTIVYKTTAQLEAGVCAFYDFLPKSFGAEKCKIVINKDRLTDKGPRDYKDFMLNIQCDEVGGGSGKMRPFIMELQFHRCDMLATKQGSVEYIRLMMGMTKTDASVVTHNGHHYYEIIRDTAQALHHEKAKKDSGDLHAMVSNLPKAQEYCDVTQAPKFPADGVKNERLWDITEEEGAGLFEFEDVE